MLQLDLFTSGSPPQLIIRRTGGDNQHAVLEGGDITLVCGNSVFGNPTPTILWVDNNGTTVSDGTGISGSTSLSLTITGVTHYQAGNWTCTAENSHGSTTRRIILTVVGKYACTNFPSA